MDYESLAGKFLEILKREMLEGDNFNSLTVYKMKEKVKEMLEEVRKEEKEAAELRSHGW